MIIDRLFTPGLAQVAYLVGDEQTGEAAVIDPRRDTDVYQAWADERGWRITAILETHVHADFVSGAMELARATGAPIYASRLGNQDFPHRSIDDGHEITVGGLTLRALWSPGHTPEHLSYLLFDPKIGDTPVALFSGDALFVGEVGRPDLLGENETQRLAEQLYDTVAHRFANLDDAVVVYPGHTAGSACGKKIGDAPHTTIGEEKRSNYAFQTTSERDFVTAVLQDMPTPPTYYPTLKRVNKAGAPLLTDLDDGSALSPAQLANLQETGALIIDARTPDAFGQGHIPDAVFAGLGPNFTTWMGWLAPYGRDVVLVLESDDEYADALTDLRRIGLDRVAGYLAGGMAAWRADGREVKVLPQLTVQGLARRLATPEPNVLVLDVRSDEEWNEGHIAGALHRFAGEIAQGAAPPVDQETPVAVICGSGYRSSVTASLLQQRGYDMLINITGGMGVWNEADLPTTG